MGLDITTIKDSEGASLYILHTGMTAEVDRFERLAEGIQAQTDRQVHLLAADMSDARKIIDFYDLRAEQLPLAMIISDDDQIVYQWQGDNIPAAEVIVHQLGQIG